MYGAVLCLAVFTFPSAAAEPVTRLPLVRAVDLDVGESAKIELADFGGDNNSNNSVLGHLQVAAQLEGVLQINESLQAGLAAAYATADEVHVQKDGTLSIYTPARTAMVSTICSS